MATSLPTIERTISGKGLIIIPPIYEEALDVVLYTQVIREVQTPSRNFTFNPDKSFYAHITFCRDDFVISAFDVNFEDQAFEIYNGQGAQNLLSLICAYDGILDSFVAVGNVLAIVISRVNLIKAHPYLTFRPNRIRFECFSSTALQLTLKGTRLDKCNSEDGTPTPPPPPPPPRLRLPPNEPVEVSPPYEGEDDDGDTVPNDLDEFPDDDFPAGEPCIPVELVFLGTSPSGLEEEIRRTVFGVVDDVRFLQVEPARFEVFVTCQGDITTGCIALQELNLFSYNGTDIELIDVIA